MVGIWGKNGCPEGRSEEVRVLLGRHEPGGALGGGRGIARLVPRVARGSGGGT